MSLWVWSDNLYPCFMHESTAALRFALFWASSPWSAGDSHTVPRNPSHGRWIRLVRPSTWSGSPSFGFTRPASTTYLRWATWGRRPSWTTMVLGEQTIVTAPYHGKSSSGDG